MRPGQLEEMVSMAAWVAMAAMAIHGSDGDRAMAGFDRQSRWSLVASSLEDREAMSVRRRPMAAMALEDREALSVH